MTAVRAHYRYRIVTLDDRPIETRAGRQYIALLHDGLPSDFFDIALAAVRDIELESAKGAVERIRSACLESRKKWGAEGLPASLQRVLDEEAAR